MKRKAKKYTYEDYLFVELYEHAFDRLPDNETRHFWNNLIPKEKQRVWDWMCGDPKNTKFYFKSHSVLFISGSFNT